MKAAKDAPEDTPSQLLAVKQQERILLGALLHLNDEFRTVLEMFYWERLTSAELGVVLDIPAPTVRSRLRRAKEAVLEQIPLVTSDEVVRGNLASDLDAWASSVRKATE